MCEMKERGTSVIIRASYSRNRIVKIATKTAAAVGCIPGVWQREKKTIRTKRRERESERGSERREGERTGGREKKGWCAATSITASPRSLIHIHPCMCLPHNVQPRRNDHVRRVAHRVRVRNLSSLASRILSLFCGIAWYIFSSRSAEPRRRNKSRRTRNDEIIYR